MNMKFGPQYQEINLNKTRFSDMTDSSSVRREQIWWRSHQTGCEGMWHELCDIFRPNYGDYWRTSWESKRFCLKSSLIVGKVHKFIKTAHNFWTAQHQHQDVIMGGPPPPLPDQIRKSSIILNWTKDRIYASTPITFVQSSPDSVHSIRRRTRTKPLSHIFAMRDYLSITSK